MDKRAIGIFDSGIGGLTVESAVSKLLPGENIIYLGDTAHVPYGTKSRATVTQYSLSIADFLVGLDIKMLVVACNTASAFAVRELREKLSIPVIDVIGPGASAAVKATNSGKIGVIGTEGTVKSRAYDDAINAISPDVYILSKSCPLFVPLAEEGLMEDNIAELAATMYLTGLAEKGVDTLVLACTHYPLLKGVISRVVGPDVALIDSAEATATEVKRVLEAEGLIHNGGGIAEYSYYVTDSPERFAHVGSSFLGKSLTVVKEVNLEG